MEFDNKDGFTARIRQAGESLCVTLPKDKLEEYKLNKGDIVLVFIKKAEFVSANRMEVQNGE